MTPHVETGSGRYVHLLEPDPQTIHFGDIAQSLSGIARYNNHTMGIIPYSVAQHSVWCAVHAYRLAEFKGNEFVLQVLLHDAHETYTGDIVAPFKYIPELHKVIKPIEDRLQKTILEALDVPPPDEEAQRLIDQIDDIALAVEAWHMVPSRGFGWNVPDVNVKVLATFKPPLDPQQAMQQFWMVYEFLKHGLPLEDLPL